MFRTTLKGQVMTLAFAAAVLLMHGDFSTFMTN
jgi:hypothetical protein